MGARATLSSTVRCGNRLKDWKTIPMRRRRASTGAPGAVSSSSPRKTRPRVGRSSMLRQRSSVDLPDPDGPMTQTTSPGATSRLTPLSTSLCPKVLWIPSARIALMG